MAVSMFSCGYVGIDAYIVEVESDVSPGLPKFNIVGMGDTAILESKERIRSCFKNINEKFPIQRVLVNLSPADVKKRGTQFDLSIMLSILLNIKTIKYNENIHKYLILGEISLNGSVKPVRGVINAAILAKENKEFRGVIVPEENYDEANLISDIEVIPVNTVFDAIKFFNGETIEINGNKYNIIGGENFHNMSNPPRCNQLYEKDEIDLSEVKGQFLAKRALEIGAAGGHSIFMIGDPGSGKSMMAKRMITILPPMTSEEVIETTKIYSVSGLLSRERSIINKRPFRSPHHTATQPALVGGSTRVGEISLALNGVLFLDEVGEFAVKSLETLRQPLEDGYITISRANISVSYPVRSITIFASNPTPSGFFQNDPQCTDSIREIRAYQRRFSGPLIDRVDLYVEVRKMSKEEMMSDEETETSEIVRERVVKAREIQRDRYNSNKLNAQMTKKELKKYCVLSKECKDIMEFAIDKLKLSGRMYDKILKISRTIADLENVEKISAKHLLEALNYRKKYENI